MFRKCMQFSAAILALFSSSLNFGDQMMSEQTSSDKAPLIILLGAPGSGKGTQAASIVQKFNVVHISTGDMFRYNISNNTPIGQKAKAYIEEGKLVPDEIVIDMLKDRLAQKDCAHGALLDGFPRTLAQAQALEALISSKYTPIVLSLQVSDKTVLDRLTGRRSCPKCNAIYHVTFTPPKKEGICDKCGTALITRSDDTEKTVKERLQIFHEQIGPLKEYYAKTGLLNEVDGESGSSAIQQSCLDIIQKRIDETKK
jgi:adenylate kinase